jgi:predicted nuclease of restriction endonuclease-like (RecB) superfamily
MDSIVTLPALPPEPDDYATLLLELKDRIASAQVRAAIAANTELVTLYWHVGHALNQRVQAAGWGAKVLERLSADLKRAFPDLNGFSPRNLRYMRQFASSWDAPVFWQPAVAKLSWSHHVVILEKLETLEARLWYAHATLEHGWSRNVLVHQIEARALERSGVAQTNFERTLPAPHADLTRELLKDPFPDPRASRAGTRPRTRLDQSHARVSARAGRRLCVSGQSIPARGRR